MMRNMVQMRQVMWSLARNLDKGAFDMIIGGLAMIRFAWMIGCMD